MVTGYSIAGYANMVADTVRMEANVQALRRAVKSGCVVLDIGTGTGIFALLAVRFGARRVYALDPHPSIDVARQLAAANGCAERIEFIQDLSTRVTLPEKADVIISDLRGVLPPLQHHIPSIADARKRLLAPGGTMIPQRDALWAAVVEAPDLYDSRVNPWNGNTYGFDMEPARRILTNIWTKSRFAPEGLLAEPRHWATLDYTAVEDPNVCGSICWEQVRPGTAHGLCLWFDALLAPGVGFSNAPGAPELLYGQAFFPLSSPVTLAAGDTVRVDLHADLQGGDYVWRWRTRVIDPRGRATVEFHQSTFFGGLLPLAKMRKCSADFVPSPGEDALIDRFVLDLLCDSTPVGEIARRLAGRFPDRFPGWPEALTKAGELSVTYSR
jgi:protein arginine N-methyltransferase 1